MQETTIKLDDILDFELLYAIKRGLSDKPDYPMASMYGNPQYVCVTVSLKSTREDYNSCQQQFDGFIEVFPLLCQRHNIKPLDGYEFFSAKRVPESAPELIKYEFFINPIEFDRMMMIESEDYRGYRHSGSILRLAFPHTEALKDGVICCFPVLKISENTVMLRVAGCNANETISTQIAFLLNKLKLVSYENRSTEFYGHGSAPITVSTLSGVGDFTNVALACLGISHFMNHQTEKGFTQFELSQDVLDQFLKPMDSAAENIYRLLGAVVPAELENLHSVEVPTIQFFRVLRDKYLDRLKKWEERLREYRDPTCVVDSREILLSAAEKEQSSLIQGLNNLERVLVLLGATPLLQDTPLARRFFVQDSEGQGESSDAVAVLQHNHQ